MTALGEAMLLAGRYDSDPVSSVHALGFLALAVTAAAALTAPAAPRQAVRTLGRTRLLSFVAGLGLVLTILLINAYGRATTWFYVDFDLEHPSGSVLSLWIAAVAAAVLALPTPVRLRIAVLLAPVVTLVTLVEVTLQGWSYSNGHMGHPVYLAPVQWAYLIAAPLATLTLGALLVQRMEQTARLAALGRVADRERLDTT